MIREEGNTIWPSGHDRNVSEWKALFGETCPEFRLKAVTDVLFKRTLYDKWNNLTISMDHTLTPGLVGFVLQRVGSEDADGEGHKGGALCKSVCHCCCFEERFAFPNDNEVPMLLTCCFVTLMQGNPPKVEMKTLIASAALVMCTAALSLKPTKSCLRSSTSSPSAVTATASHSSSPHPSSRTTLRREPGGLRGVSVSLRSQ